MSPDLGPQSAPPGSSLAGALACLFALLAGGAGLALIGAMPAQHIAVLSAPILLGGAAYPVLLRATPVEPSALKLLLFAGLGSPLVLLCLATLARVYLPQREALGSAFLAVAFLQPLALGRPLRCERLGGAAWLTLLVSALLCWYLSWLLFSEPGGARQLAAGALRNGGMAQGLLRSGSPENPWLAATPARWASAYHGLIALVSASMEIDVLRAQAGLTIVAAAWLPLALYLLAAPLWGRAIPCVLAAPMALLGWNAAAGLRGFIGPAGGSTDRWADRLALLTPGAEAGAVPYGLSIFVGMGPEPWALTLAVSAWMAGAHALRHGQRPWPGLCACLHLGAIAVDPRLGVVAGVTTLLAYLALLVLPLRRAPVARMGGAWLVILLGGFGLVRLLPAGSTQYPEPAPWDAYPGGVGPAILLAATPLLFLALVALVAWKPPADEQELAGESSPGRGTVALLVVFAVGLPGLGAAHEFLGVGNAEQVARPAGDALRLASFALAVLAAGGLGRLFAGGTLARVVAAALTLGLGFGALRVGLHAHAAHHSLAKIAGPLVERGMGLDLRSPGPADRAFSEGLSKVRATPAWREGQPLLLCTLDAGVPVERSADGQRSWPQLAGLVADLPLYVERDRAVDFGRKEGRKRAERWASIHNVRKGLAPSFAAELRALGRPVLILLREADRKRSAIGKAGSPRGLELDFVRLGATVLERDEELTILLLDGPQP